MPSPKTDKVDEKTDKVHPGGLSLIKSSPGSQHTEDDNQISSQVSALIQESRRKPEVSSPIVDVNEQNTDIDSWLGDSSHKRTPYLSTAEECISYVISDVEDHKADAATAEVNKLTVIFMINDDKLSII